MEQNYQDFKCIDAITFDTPKNEAEYFFHGYIRNSFDMVEIFHDRLVEACDDGKNNYKQTEIYAEIEKIRQTGKTENSDFDFDTLQWLDTLLDYKLADMLNDQFQTHHDHSHYWHGGDFGLFPNFDEDM